MLVYTTEILHIQRNKLSGSVDGFMCANLPSEFELDCEGGIPDVQCTCCIGCVSENVYFLYNIWIIRRNCSIPLLMLCNVFAKNDRP